VNTRMKALKLETDEFIRLAHHLLPKGYKRIKSGLARSGDIAFDGDKGKWFSVDVYPDYVGTKATEFVFLARKERR